MLYFYPRSPCGERRNEYPHIRRFYAISIHALLAESDPPLTGRAKTILAISIHALLAESDKISNQCEIDKKNFYPRSPCGERQEHTRKAVFNFYFYPRSPCGERRDQTILKVYGYGISIHALLAESDDGRRYDFR